MSARDMPAARAVYDGLHHAGDVIEAPGPVWEATDDTGRLLGSFPSRAAAEDAVLCAWRRKARPA